MKFLVILALTFFAIQACGQDYLLVKKGRSYLYMGDTYKTKELGVVYQEFDDIMQNYTLGRTSMKTGRTILLAGVLSMGIGSLMLANSNDFYISLLGSMFAGGGIVIEIFALHFLAKGHSNLAKARQTFNLRMLEKHGLDLGVSFGLGSTNNGVGLIVKF